MSTLRSALALATVLAAGLPMAAQAQSAAFESMRPAVSVNAGAFQFDLSGTGTAPMIAGRAELPLNRYLLAEGGLSVARPEQQFGGTTTFFVPEAQIQAQLPLADGRVAPYLGLGAGYAIDRRTSAFGGTRSDPTFSGATGVRYWVTDASACAPSSVYAGWAPASPARRPSGRSARRGACSSRIASPSIRGRAWLHREAAPFPLPSGAPSPPTLC